MKQRRRILLVLETILIIALCTGCWNYREIEKNTIVSGIAIDKGTAGYKYHLTYEVLHFPGGNDQSVRADLLESDGDLIFEAIRKAMMETDQKLYFSNCNIVILSKEIAKEGLAPLTDFFLRDAEPRITLQFAVSDEDTAEKILSNQTKTNEPASFKIYKMMQESQNVLGHILSIPLYEVYNTLNSENQDLTLPNIRLVKIAENLEPQLTTNVIFHQGKMVGYMPEDDNLFYLILKNKVKSGILPISVSSNEKNVSLEILKCDTKLEPNVCGNNVTMKIQVELLAGIGEKSSLQENDIAGNKELKKIERAASKTLKDGLTNLIYDIQNDYGTDILGFGNKINQDRHADWEKLSKNWDQTFKKVKCEITADVKINGTAITLLKGGR